MKAWLHWLQKWPWFVPQTCKMAKNSCQKKAKIFRNFRNKSRSILMLHKINKNKKCAPKLIFFNENFFLKHFDDFWCGKLKILALFDSYFWPFNKSHEKIIAIFVISAIIASIWNVFIKYGSVSYTHLTLPTILRV